MNKTADIAKVSVKGSFHVLWGLVISSIIGAVGTIFIARLLGSDLYGLYTIVLTVPILIQIFRDWGVTAAMVRFTAQYRSEGRLDEIRSVFLTGLLFEVAVGLALSIFSFLFADFLAASVFNRPAIAPLIQIVSFSILAGGLISAATAAFTGFERLELNSVMMIFQSIFRTAFIIALVAVGLGTQGATIGFTIGIFLACAIGVGLIYSIYRKLPKPNLCKYEIKAYLTTMLTYCLPLSIATLISTLLSQFYAFLLPIHYATDNVPIGNYGVAVNFVVLIAFFVTPIATTMFPAFSRLDPEKDKTSLKNVFQFSTKYGALLVVPATVLVMCLSGPAVETLFGDTFAPAALYLSLFAIQYLYVALGNVSLAPLLNGTGQTSYTLKLSVLTGIIGFPLGFTLIMLFGVIGLIAASLACGIPSLLLGLRFIRQKYGISVDWTSSLRILFSAFIAGGLTYFLVLELPFASLIKLIVGVAFFLVILLLALLLSRSITRDDISNLQSMIGGLGTLGNIANKLLLILEKVMNALKL